MLLSLLEMLFPSLYAISMSLGGGKATPIGAKD